LSGHEEKPLPKSVESDKLLAVEGIDEINFFEAYLNFLGIKGVDILDVAGKDNFKIKLPVLFKMPGFNNVRIFAVIRDADDNAESAFKSIQNILIKSDLKPPDKLNNFSNGSLKVGIFIMPGNSDKGMLEDLCLQSVQDHPAMECVDIFYECFNRLEEKPRIAAKAKAQAFLAAMPETVYSVGMGAKKKYWDFEAAVLNDLKIFLRNFK